MVSWIHLSDLQIGQSPEADASSREVVKMAVGTRPDFIVDTGDCVNGAVDDTAAEKKRVKALWADYRRTVRPILKSCPFFVVPGNHDLTGSNPSITTFLRQTDRAGKPAYFAASVKGVHLIGLDVVPGRHNTGGFRPESPQGKWLARHLRRERRSRCTVVAAHYPIFVPPAQQGGRDDSLTYDEETGAKGALLPLLEEAGVDLYLCGHFHSYERCRRRRLTQVMPACHGPALDHMLGCPPKFRCAIDNGERRSFTRFTLNGDRLRGEAIAIDGQTIDRWWQKLNR